MNFIDPGLGAVEAQLWHWLALSIRCSAAMLAAPIFGAMSIPIQLRVLIGVALAFFISNWVPVGELPRMLSFGSILLVLHEAAIGVALGFVLQLAFAIPLIAAEQISGTMGLAIATSIDPNSGAQSGAIGQYFSVVLTLLFFIVGGHLIWLELVVESYRQLPPGVGSLTSDMASGIAQFAGTAFASAAAIALPVVLALLLVQTVTGVLSRSAPSLNLFALGLPAGVLAGLAALIMTFNLLTEQLTEVIALALTQIASMVAA